MTIDLTRSHPEWTVTLSFSGVDWLFGDPAIIEHVRRLAGIVAGWPATPEPKAATECTPAPAASTTWWQTHCTECGAADGACTCDPIDPVVVDDHCPDCGERATECVCDLAPEPEPAEGRKKDRTCSIEGCDRPHRARGLCARHYWTHYESVKKARTPAADAKIAEAEAAANAASAAATVAHAQAVIDQPAGGIVTGDIGGRENGPEAVMPLTAAPPDPKTVIRGPFQYGRDVPPQPMSGMYPIRWDPDADPAGKVRIVVEAYRRCGKDTRAASKMLGLGLVEWDHWLSRARRDGLL